MIHEYLYNYTSCAHEVMKLAIYEHKQGVFKVEGICINRCHVNYV